MEGGCLQIARVNTGWAAVLRQMTSVLPSPICARVLKIAVWPSRESVYPDRVDAALQNSCRGCCLVSCSGNGVFESVPKGLWFPYPLGWSLLS